MNRTMEADATVEEMPLSTPLWARLVEAVIVGSVWVASSRLHGHPAARLVAIPPEIDVRGRFDFWLCPGLGLRWPTDCVAPRG